MTLKLPRHVIDELDGLVEELSRNDPQRRESALVKLTDNERSGRVPLPVLLEMAGDERPTLSMYAISALGRNGGPAAVNKLLELLEAKREGNALLVETIVDALGECGSATAAPALLGLLGMRTGWTNKLFNRKARREEPVAEAELRLREYLTLPVIRALARIADPKTAALLGDYLAHPDPLVRWHAIQNLRQSKLTDFNDRLKRIAEQDQSALVRELASIALEQLNPLPPNLNN
jgi:HEAT repeat protein